MAAIAVLLSGCGGSDGANGVNGTNGVNGVNGVNGSNGIATTNAAVLTPDQWANARFTGAITGVTIASSPVVTFKISDAAGNPVVGLGTQSKSSTATLASYPNVAFTIAKLVPGTKGSPSKWVSYNVTTVPTTSAASLPGKPTTDNTGTLVDNGDGTYKYTFWRDITKIKDTVAGMAAAAKTANANNDVADLGDLTYDPSLTHRVVLQLSGNAPGTGTNTPNGVQAVAGVPMNNPLNLVYDFIPATGKPVGATDAQREIVKVTACFECHSKFTFHGGSRQDTRICATCHTDQRKYGNAEAATTATGYSGFTYKINNQAVGDLPAFVHRIHMGEELTKTGYNFANILFNDIKYPQDQRNCVKCHDGSSGAKNQTAQGDNWKTVPNRMACGACHDGINWATGKGTALGANGQAVGGHVGGAQNSDANCALCHDSASIPVYHTPVTPPSSAFNGWNGTTTINSNAAWVAAYQNNLPAGASKISYDLNSVTVDANKHAVIKFKILKDGKDVVFNTYSASGKTELIDNFVGSPSVYVAFALPQDGIAKPADFNASISGYIKNLWNGSASGTGAGTLTGPDANGYYTATLTGAIIPANAVMVNGGVGYTYAMPTTQPLTQTNVPGFAYNASTRIGGLIVAAPVASKVAAGYTGRRQIVENARCNNCHAVLGVFTSEGFHAGQRNDSNTCAWCHKPNQTSSGWSADSSTFIHGIHGASKRSQPFTWHATSATEGFWDVEYPGVLNNCEQCHLPDTYNFAASASAAAVPNLLPSTVGAGTYAAPAAGAAPLSPYVTPGVNYGAGYTVAAATGVATEAAATTLVNSPISSACFSCHDTAAAVAHIQGNGGSIYAPRSSALAKVEQCLVCHGAGKVADVKVVHGVGQ